VPRALPRSLEHRAKLVEASIEQGRLATELLSL
jgi:hypothetical protein